MDVWDESGIGEEKSENVIQYLKNKSTFCFIKCYLFPAASCEKKYFEGGFGGSMV